MKNYNKLVYEILNEKFFTFNKDYYPYDFSHSKLCSIFCNSPLKNEWEIFWKIINTDSKLFIHEYFNNYPAQFETDKKVFIYDYFNDYPVLPEQALLRLLIVEEFKTWLKENKDERV